MHTFYILDTRQFMTHLFKEETFNRFELVQGQITTFAAFTIDGSLHPEYFDSEEQKETEDSRLAKWDAVQRIAFDLIKGKHTPLFMKFVFRLSDEDTARFLQTLSTPFGPGDTDGLFLNIRYENNHVICTSGCSLKVFSLDKSLEHAWDEAVRAFFRKNEITVSDQDFISTR